MAITYQSSTTAADDGAGNTVVSYPASIGAGDLLVYHFTTRGTISVEPSGLTLIESVTQGSITERVYWKIASGSESGSVTWTTTAANKSVGAISRYTSGSTPSVHVQDKSVGTSTAPIAPDVTAVATNTLVIRSLGVAGGPNVSSPPATQRYAIDASASSSCLERGSDATQVSAGPTGTATWVLSASQNWIARTIVFKEAIALPPQVYWIDG